MSDEPEVPPSEPPSEPAPAKVERGCSNCGKSGHYWRNCPDRLAKLKPVGYGPVLRKQDGKGGYRTPEQIQADREKMAHARAARGKRIGVKGPKGQIPEHIPTTYKRPRPGPHVRSDKIPTEPTGKVTADELERMVADMARNGEGPDKFRAIKMAQGFLGNDSREEATTPMQRVMHLTLLMDLCGLEETHAAYIRAHGQKNPKHWRENIREEGSMEAKAQGIAVHEGILASLRPIGEPPEAGVLEQQR